MIQFNYETEFQLDNEEVFTKWISAVIISENKKEGEINYIFCDDEYLHKINVEHLGHDTLTDIISFDYSIGNEIHGDIFVSIERVKDNALDFEVSFDEELKRVLVHGVLHYCGYKDKSESDELIMRTKEDEKIAMFHVERL
jgi:rRNA maturation RNase YbeY